MSVIGASGSSSTLAFAQLVACASVRTMTRRDGMPLSFTSAAPRRTAAPASPAPSSERRPAIAAVSAPLSPPTTAPSIVTSHTRSPLADPSTIPRAAAERRASICPSAPAAAEESELSRTIATAVGACPTPGSHPTGRAAANASERTIAMRSTISSMFLSRTSRECSRSMRNR
jgi:hypothetical protein